MTLDLKEFMDINMDIKLCQKSGVAGFSGCTEHGVVIWDQIQSSNRDMKDLHVLWLDLENTYGSVPHQLISFVLVFFHVLPCVKKIIESYYANLKICHLLLDYTTDWQQLGRGTLNGMLHLSHSMHNRFWDLLDWCEATPSVLHGWCYKPCVDSCLHCMVLQETWGTAVLGQTEKKACQIHTLNCQG